MNIIGHMIVRNEADIIEETIREAFRWLDVLVVLDGQSTDGTYSLLRDLSSQYDIVGKTLHVVSEPDTDEQFKIDCRNRLLELTAPFNPDWVFSVDADEIYHYDPILLENPLLRTIGDGVHLVRSEKCKSSAIDRVT
jgi:glycosyltransferase involved in cell wall biosynthesis